MGQIQQALSKEQREELESFVGLLPQIARGFLFILFVLVISFLLRSLQHLLFLTPAIWIIPAAATGIWLYRHSKRWTGGPALRRQIRQDIKNGLAMITLIEPVSVVEIEEQEDEGLSFIIETKEGDTILLTGQEMNRYKRKKFPWSKFGVIEAPESRHFFGLKRMGEPILVNRTLPPIPYNTVKELGCYNEIFIILDEYKKELLNETWKIETST